LISELRRLWAQDHSYHGLSDPTVPVLGTIKYYEEMAQQLGGLERAQQFSRFFPDRRPTNSIC
jgi:hypothetical protein